MAYRNATIADRKPREATARLERRPPDVGRPANAAVRRRQHGDEAPALVRCRAGPAKPGDGAAAIARR